MKKTIASVTCGGLLLLVIPLLFLRCQNINPFNDTRFPNNMSNSHPPILIEFVDEDQPNIMFPKNLTISISNSDRNLVLRIWKVKIIKLLATCYRWYFHQMPSQVLSILLVLPLQPKANTMNK
jgi:hypothetical protein